MLDTATKRRIDTARDILVGKVPDPKSQVEQITIALIYKFMDDMDAESEEVGGERSFFANGFAQYSWAKLMRSGLGGHETLNLYAEAIAKMPENPGIPALFRSIFKHAFLPYRDPETLKSFLKVIDEFEYDHSERLGDAFEYLLSVLGSQGDAGQFRTPRHIIDFMVKMIDPKKHEKILDPACGTAGFLISSFKHIRDANNSSPLTPDEKGALAANIKGYDISPDMVRLSLVNLYLHGFNDPHIEEYDTLTSQEKWNEYADVILANPPFMSPKGGIKPHDRFTVQSKRSEVLFVDYMAEHLTPNGRAAIIVPEGIIFQSGKAYKELRKMLVDSSLVAVISLPAGVFQPYSGVKTSILILDKSLARQSKSIGFFKVENDGFALGAQRRPIEKNDLPAVLSEVEEFLYALRKWHTADDLTFSMGLSVSKERIAENGEYNLSGERYRESDYKHHAYPLVSLGDPTIFRIESGGTPRSDNEDYWGGNIPWATLVDLPANDFITQIYGTQRTITEKGLKESSAKIIPANSIIVSTRATIGRIAINRVPIATNQGFKNIIIEDTSCAIPEFVALCITRLVPTMKMMATGGTFAELSKSKFSELQIPLPALEIQKEIVAEIDGYQKVIDGARAVVDNYKPHIPIDPEWEKVSIRDISSQITKGTTPTTAGYSYQNSGISFIKVESISEEGFFIPEKFAFISEECHRAQSRSQLKADDVLFSIAGALGRVAKVPSSILPANTNQALAIITPVCTKVDPCYLAYNLKAASIMAQAEQQKTGVAQYNLSLQQVGDFILSLPPLEIQQSIVAEIEAEQALVNANRELIERFEKKIQKNIARVWGEDESFTING